MPGSPRITETQMRALSALSQNMDRALRASSVKWAAPSSTLHLLVRKEYVVRTGTYRRPRFEITELGMEIFVKMRAAELRPPDAD